ncbi:MAG: phospholipase D-like domain-containing protein [Azoarcus sp.]|nr:phospholipase D-like domain-containing protein [Azoarcus sp.]
MAEILNAYKEKGCYTWWGGRELPIGELLVQKARQGVKVRVLGWVTQVAAANLAGLPFTADETTAHGRALFGNRIGTSEDAQFEYDKYWFYQYDRDPGPTMTVLNAHSKMTDAIIQFSQRIFAGNDNESPANKKLQFYPRGFTTKERARILQRVNKDPTNTLIKKILLGVVPTHHQKMVLVDYESPKDHIGFVMGHNMLDEYWDIPEHSYKRHPYNAGRNGDMPREDLSSRVRGPICENLFLNFKDAWEKEGCALGDPMPPWPKAAHDAYWKDTLCKDQAKTIFGLILRTQPQFDKFEIKTQYELVIPFATQYIYMENQYFRYMPVSDKLKEAAKQQFSNGRDPKEHGHLNVFVITNSSDTGVGPGIDSTYEMLESLGRADTIPNVAQQNRIEKLEDQIKQTENQIVEQGNQLWILEKKQTHLSRKIKNFSDREPGETSLNLRAQQQETEMEIARTKKERKAQEAQEKELKKKREELAKDPEGDHIKPEEIPGLRIHICTLVPPDLPPLAAHHENLDAEIEQAREDAEKARHRYIMGGPLEKWEAAKRKITELEKKKAASGGAVYWKDQAGKLFWPEVYVHSKLMIINDAFMTAGSANINTRSMEVDSELNISHYTPTIVKQARKDLWEVHTRGYVDKGGQTGLCASDNPDVAFEAWGRLIEDNRKAEKVGAAPLASLRGFLRTSPETSGKD